MKRFFKSLTLATLLVALSLPAWSQSSTEGKEFWVALTLCAAPSDGLPEPFIAISTKQNTRVTISNPNILVNGQPWSITRDISANQWEVFDGSAISLDKWYPQAANSIANAAQQASKTNNFGLKVVADHDISVYAALRMENSFDAANVLPIHALQREYYTQDYPPYIKPDDGESLSMFTVLATANGTNVAITPACKTHDNKAAGQTFNVTLNAGQTYYVISETLQSLSGSHVVADKPVAVFQGDVFTQIPGGKAARDCTYEQAMPVDYWGTQFVITRSLQKDANRIRITAMENGTEIFYGSKANGTLLGMCNAGETFEIEMYKTLPTQQGLIHQPDIKLQEDAAFIETSCPVAVYSYDVSNGYQSTPTEMINSHGDPSAVWVSPIQQKIGNITFGTCYTNKTTDHCINVLAETSACQNTVLKALKFDNILNRSVEIDKSSLLVWTPVPNNPFYSYARAMIGDANTQDFSVFRLENAKGFNAIVYGNGNDESYAYSAGSAAVERGVNVDGETFTNGFKSDSRFCLDRPLQFDSKVGTDEITRVDWTFGDGTSEYNGMPQTEHTYTSPGWYDVTAKLFGHQVCTDESNQELGTVHFTFRVMPPDTVYMKPEHRCISVDSVYDGRKLTAEEIAEMIANGGNDTTQVNPEDCSSEVHITPVSYGIDTEEKLDTITGEDQATGHNNKIYYASTDVIDTIPATVNRCAIYRKYYVKVITCLAMTVTNDSAAQHVCPNNTLDIEYTKTKGDLGEARFVIPGVLDEEVNIDNYNTQMGKLSLPTQNLKPGLYKGELKVEDQYCDNKTFPIDVAVYYPKDIFLYKFNNVLAVYKKGFGGNNEYNLADYTFQWYRNYLPIEGATESVLYLGDGVTFEIGDEVHVALIDKNGVRIPSCGQTITSVPDYNIPDQQQAPARKMIINNKIVIQREDQTYDIYGQKVR